MADSNQEYLTSIKKRIREFETQHRQISKSVEIYGRYNPWLSFKCNGLEIDTANPKNKHIILQTWEYNKNGSGHANNFTLRICYNFAEAAEQYKIPDIHYVEKALCIQEVIKNKDGIVTGFKSVYDKLKCTFRYGYLNVGSEASQLLSQEYEGIITNCTPELRDNMLFYTIEGRSLAYGGIDAKTEQRLKDIKINFDAKENVRATQLAYDILDKYYGSGYQDDDNPYKNLLTDKYNIINLTETLGFASREKSTSFKEATGVTVFEYISEILSYVDLTGYGLNQEAIDKIPKDQLPYYTFYVDDVEGKKSIVIDVVDPTGIIRQSLLEAGESEDSLPVDANRYDTSIVFEYPSKEQNFVFSFIPDLDLNIIFSQLVFDGEHAKRWGIDSGGMLIETGTTDDNGFITVTKVDEDTTASTSSELPNQISGENATSVDSAAEENATKTEESIKNAATFSQAVNQVYEASMSCMGIPADIPLQTKIKIMPILNGVPYMFSGCYMVKTCRDRIDSNGYITEMELLRLQDYKVDIK